MISEGDTNSKVHSVEGDRNIRTALLDQIFAVAPHSHAIFPLNSDKLMKLCPKFNPYGLDSRGLWEMCYLVEKLEVAQKEVENLKKQRKHKESEALNYKIRIVKDPLFSEDSDLHDLFKATKNLDMCVSFLGLKNVRGARIWLDFIIRSWGEAPIY